MQVKLRVLRGSNAGKEVLLPAATFLIGRGEECHLRPKSEAISRRHCAVNISDNQVIVEDFGSKNGTFVNDQRVEGNQVLKPGDQLRIGPLEFEVVIEQRLGGTKRPAVRDVKEVAARTANSDSVDEQDITGWLEEADDTISRKVADTDTRHYRVDDTNRVKLESTSDTMADQPVPTASEPEATDEAKEEKKEGKKKPGKLPITASKKTTDSREAAADMLKRFFNRR